MSTHVPGMPPPTTRRRFLQGAVATFTALWGLLALIPIYRYLRPSSRLMAQTDVRRVEVGTAASLPVNQGKNFEFGSTPAIVVHTPDGAFHAFNAICTHLGCTVQYRPDMQRIWCACHGGQYDPVTGKNVAGPPPRPLEVYPVAVENGKIVVNRA